MAARVKPEFETASVVLVGNFNPRIFHPAWLAARDLIAEDAVEGSTIGAITDQVAAFRVDWLELHILASRFQASTSDPSHYPSLSELVRGVFSLLEFTPVRQMGINRSLHLRVRDEDEWHRLGDLWAPKEPWQDILSGKRPCGRPGTGALTIQGDREGSTAVYTRVTVAPSGKVTPGIYVSTNEHYQLAEEEPVGTLMRTLEAEWTEAQDFALRVADHLLGESV